MFGRKFSSNIRRKKRMIISTIILLVVFLSVGYAAFTTDLSIGGTLNVSKYDHTLYGVLEKAVSQGYAREYTGNHQDSMAGVGTEKIYHWWADNDTDGTAITDMNNVIFANHCWQMIRTTDTGGVKMMYNGEPENGQCLNTRGNHVGYTSRGVIPLSTSYYYGTSYNYDKTNNTFSLAGTITTGTVQEGQYTCRNTSATATCYSIYLVDEFSSGTAYTSYTIGTNSHYSQFGMQPINLGDNPPAHVGYMYNSVYQTTDFSPLYTIQNASIGVNANYYYSDTIDYGNQNAGNYTLTNPVSMSTVSDNSILVGKYVLNQSGTYSTTARYILAVKGTALYYRTLENGDLSIKMQVGDSYTDNGNGTYTINNPTEVTYIDWYGGAYANNKNKYACDGASATCTNIKHIVGNTTSTSYNYFDAERKYKYSESVNYSGGTYTLTGDIKEMWDMSLTTNQATLATHHYTCLSTGTTCATVNYINYYSEPRLYYTQLNNVANISEALTKMSTADDINQTNSTIKKLIDAWYEKYMINYTSKLEDTIFCNERSITNLGGWNPNGGETNAKLEYKSVSSSNDLSCTNITDKFSINNNKAKLTYPVGLLTYPEAVLLNNDNIRNANKYYWLFSPLYVSVGAARTSSVGMNGNINNSPVSNSNGIRPVISLKPGTEYTSGSGSMADPYVVE